MPTVPAFTNPGGKDNPPTGSVKLDGTPIQLSDSNYLTESFRGFQCDVAGTIKLTFVDGSTDTWTVLAGVQYGACFCQVFVTGTSATGIHGLR